MKWTDEEIDVLKKFYGTNTAKDISWLLKRSTYSIYHQARRLGLKSTLQRHKRNAS